MFSSCRIGGNEYSYHDSLTINNSSKLEDLCIFATSVQGKSSANNPVGEKSSLKSKFNSSFK